MESAYELVPRKRPFTSGIEAVKDVLAFAFFRRDWVGVQCTLVQDRKECIGWMPGH